MSKILLSSLEKTFTNSLSGEIASKKPIVKLISLSVRFQIIFQYLHVFLMASMFLMNILRILTREFHLFLQSNINWQFVWVFEEM